MGPNNYGFPPAPVPQGYAGFGGYDPRISREQQRQSIMDQLMGAPAPRNIGEGIASIGDALLYRSLANHTMPSDFPEMPGGGRPGFFQGLANMFGGGGGLY